MLSGTGARQEQAQAKPLVSLCVDPHSTWPKQIALRQPNAMDVLQLSSARV